MPKPNGEPVEADGATVEEAIAKALVALGIGREQAAVEILHDAKRSVLGFGGRPARVRVAARGELDPSVAAPSPTPTGTAGVEDPAAVLEKLLALIDVPAQIDATPGEEPGQISLRISSPAGGLLIGRHGQTLDALEYLVNRIVSRHDERSARIVIDAEGYRERRNQELREMASRIAARVRQTFRAHTMNPLSPRERRIVHMALADDHTVVTRSTGEGQLRRIVILPANAPEPRTGGRASRRSF